MLSIRFAKKLPGPFSVAASSPQMPRKAHEREAASSGGQTARNAAHIAPSIQPVPVTRDRYSHPFFIRRVRLPSVTMSVFPLAMTVQPYFTARAAAAYGCEWFTTTLSVSPHKNAPYINQCGERLAGEYAVRFLPSDFKKRGGYARSVELSRSYGLYRQDYCGCVFSKEARFGSVLYATFSEMIKKTGSRQNLRVSLSFC